MARERSLLLVVIVVLVIYSVYNHLSTLSPAAVPAGFPAQDGGPRRKTTNKAADMKIGMVTMNNRETSYTVMSLANKHGMSLAILSRRPY